MAPLLRHDRRRALAVTIGWISPGMTPPTRTKADPGWRDRLLAAYYRRRFRGFLSLCKLLKNPGNRAEIEASTHYGSRFLLRHGDGIDRHVLAEGFYESEVLEAVRPHLAPGAVLWVVGANFGLHAITAKLLHPTTRVVAFEPFPALCGRILENCRLNGLELELHSYALSDRSGSALFHAVIAGNPGRSTLHPTDADQYDQRFHVAVEIPAQIIDRGHAPAPTAMIIDAEGSELQILRGFGPHLFDPRLRAIVFEESNDFLNPDRPSELRSLLLSAGFEIRILVRAEFTAHFLSNYAATRTRPSADGDDR
jgi:FkbM family methyltransferase